MADNYDAIDEDTEGASPEERVLNEAKKRFKKCESWEAGARKRFVEDLKFANADADNLWQWPNAIRQNRDIDSRPCLTINKTRQHNLQIINDARQNKPAIKVNPVGDEATYESAQVLEAVVRHIEYISTAQAAYDTATRFQVQAGIGYWRVVTDYAGDDSFDQEIFIRRIKDPLSVYIDPDIREVDGSDARFAFIFDDLSKDEFNEMYPQYKDKATVAPLNSDETWVREDNVRVAEYFRKVEKEDRLIAMTDPNSGIQTMVRESKVPKELLAQVMDDPQTKFRTICESEVERFLIVGDEIAEQGVWPGRYIPICRVVAEETVIEGELDRKGHTRAMKDPQRIYNYWSSSAVEMVALQGKTKFMGPAETIEGQETYWETANIANYAYLPHNQYDDQGRPLNPPTPIAPPVMAQAYLQGMQVSSEELRAVSGQWQSELGMPSNERSGIAIQQRQRQGENATYHYIDHLAIAIRYTGKIIIDLIPKIYDTPRVIKIMGEDGTQKSVNIDPNAQAAWLEKQQSNHDKVEGIFNPNVGKYDVEADIGPAFATKRQEAFNAISQVAAQSPEVMQMAGDILFRAADFPMADELAERFKRAIPAHLLGDAPPPQIQQMQQAIQQLNGLLKTTMEELAEEKRKKTFEGVKANADAYRAETDRMKVFADHNIDIHQFASGVAKLILDMQQTDIEAANDQQQQTQQANGASAQ